MLRRRRTAGLGAFLEEVELEPSRMVLGRARTSLDKDTESRASVSRGRQVPLLSPVKTLLARVLATPELCPQL